MTPPGECSSQVTYFTDLNVDFREYNFWIDEACRDFDELTGTDSAALLAKYGDVQLTVEEELDICPPDVVGCAFNNGKMYIKHVSLPGQTVRHETLHLLMWQYGWPSAIHHGIMEMNGWL